MPFEAAPKVTSMSGRRSAYSLQIAKFVRGTMSRCTTRWVAAFGSALLVMTVVLAGGRAYAQEKVAEPSAPNVGNGGRAAFGVASQADRRIKVGQAARYNVSFWCVQNGEYVDDTVTPSLTGHPRADGERSPTFNPRTLHTNPPSSETSALVVSTTERTRPGVYTLELHGTGPKCGDYTPATTTLEIAPKITGPATVWWFNREEPDGYDVDVRLDVLPINKGPYAFRVVTGSQYAQFLNGSPTFTTSSPAARVEAKAAPPKNQGNATVTVRVRGVTSDPHKLKVLRPYRDVYLFTADRAGVGIYAGSFESNIHYKIIDQFGRQLPANVPINERFNSTPIPDDAAANWSTAGAPLACAGGVCPSIAPADWMDFIAIDRHPTLTPLPLRPQTPLRTQKIDHWSGMWRVGSGVVGRGVPVHTNVWQRYRDHGRHCRIQSPPGEAPIQPSCPGP